MDGTTVVPSLFTRGPWDPTLLHGGAVGALLAEVAQAELDPAFSPVRLTVDLMKPVPLRPMVVAVEIVRTGRRLQLLEARLRDGPATVASATLLALRPVDVEDDGWNPPVSPPPDGPDDAEASEWANDPAVEAFVGGGQDFRFLPSTTLGTGVGWFRLRRPVLGADVRANSPLARAVSAADVGGAVSARRQSPGTSFVNADISVQLGRAPVGEWIRLVSVSRWEASGIGWVASELWDGTGRFGSAHQALVLDRR
ncbi:MAG: thioesterase family protein [Actinomycetota bacterium]|nr:thioesterase family protein [Actinomycetota bacterium]